MKLRMRRGNRLKTFKVSVREQCVNETDFVNIKVPQLGVFDFRAFLNIAMLITESERARLLRQMILDIVIDTIHAYPISTGLSDSAEFVYVEDSTDRRPGHRMGMRTLRAGGYSPDGGRRPSHQGKDAETPTESEGNPTCAGTYPKALKFAIS